MRFSTYISVLAGSAIVAAIPGVSDKIQREVERVARDEPEFAKVIVENITNESPKISPKVFIISMFQYEADIWYDNSDTEGSIGNLLAQNITVSGFSMLFPDAHCLADGSVCQLTTGEAEINAASTIQALMLSPLFNLTETYFMIAGIAGVNPEYGTLGSVAFSKYAVQVALQYEFDAREIPDNYSTGYIPLGSDAPDQYPTSIYGTEVFEVNEALRDIAVNFAIGENYTDSAEAIAYRANYLNSDIYSAATLAPSVIKCDVATSDVYYSGTLLGEAFTNTTSLFTNGSGIYCMTAQEDNASLEAMIRASINGIMDFSRIIVMRTASDFDRPYPGVSDEFNLFYADQGGFEPAIENIYIAGTPVVKGILDGWESTFKAGINATNYIGDIFGSLGGEPDFGPGSSYGGEEVDLNTVGLDRRALYRKNVSRRTMKGHKKL
ncbi:purine nucleoside permease-domain-containing protein [Calycina marina]|uniref:Purine nucleoside permease-domain-containing protein n=1 Tax=Calycina marina TaxID=1763456 RepID=A0A9P7ZB13_9HELO|nr:purine nucleoside permease-domain-containing protein [Calycina marina]